MALDGLGFDDIEMDGDMSQPSDPMPYKRKCFGVSSYSVFHTKKFLEKIFGKWCYECYECYEH